LSLVNERVIVSRVIQIVADAGCEKKAEVFRRQIIPEMTQMEESVHHLGDAEAMPEVVERIVPVVLLHTQLRQK